MKESEKEGRALMSVETGVYDKGLQSCWNKTKIKINERHSYNAGMSHICVYFRNHFMLICTRCKMLQGLNKKKNNNNNFLYDNFNYIRQVWINPDFLSMANTE